MSSGTVSTNSGRRVALPLTRLGNNYSIMIAMRNDVGLASRMRGLCLIFLHIHASRQICDFPMFLQQHANGTVLERIWEHGVRKQLTEFETEMTFQRHVWRTVSSSSSGRDKQPLLRMCEEQDEGHRYMVSDTKDAPHEMYEELEVVYSCVQFVLRSSWVVQIRQSIPLTKSNATVCRGVSLVQDTRLLISRQIRAAFPPIVTQSCSLRGGFVIKPMEKSPVSDDRVQDPLCAGYRGEMRLESGCLDGEGMTFYFRHKHCIPDGLYMFSTQPAQCLGSWTDGPYAFSLLKHDRLPHSWVVRHPYVLDNSFTIYLFEDLVAPTMDNAGGLPGVVGFLAVRDSPRPATSLCTDEHEACSTWPKPCLSSLVTTLTCPRTCGVCNASRPIVCSFPAELQGLWYDPETDAPTVLINRTMLTVYGRPWTEETYHCIDWEFASGVQASTRKGRPPKTTWEAMVVNGFLSGCRPRYSCVRFLRRTPFALYLKLSETQTWPLVSSPEEVIDCRSFAYDRADDGALSPEQNRFRDRHFRLVYSMREVARRTQCHLPPEGLVDLEVTFSNGNRSLASLTESGPSGTEFIVSLSDVTNSTASSASKGSPRVYQCLDSTDALPYSDLFLVTRTANEALVLWCWVFPRNRTGIFYQLRADQCNRAAGRRFRKDQLNPYATYTTVPNFTTTKQSHPEEPEPSHVEGITVTTTGNVIVQLDGPSSTEVMTAFEGRKTARDGKRFEKEFSENPGDLNETTTEVQELPISWVIVLLLVLICVVIQIPCS